MNNRAIWIAEGLALVFGMLVILVTFGDPMPIPWVGNLDSIFGQTRAPFMDLIYPIASTGVFLLHGRSRPAFQLSWKGLLPLLAFLAVSVAIQFDDILVVLDHRRAMLPGAYWDVARPLYFLVAVCSFFAFRAWSGVDAEAKRANER